MAISGDVKSRFFFGFKNCMLFAYIGVLSLNNSMFNLLKIIDGCCIFSLTNYL